MILPNNEKAIIAGFRKMDEAEKAAQQLKDLGVEEENISINRISEHPVTEYEKELKNPITGDYPGLANAVFNREMDRDPSVLLAADPSASGLSGNEEDIGIDIILTAVINNSKFDQAEKIVRQLGGQF